MSIVTDSRKVIPGCIFVALKGHKTDGHNFLKQAIVKGAKTLVVENKEKLRGLNFKGELQIVSDTKRVLSSLLNSFYDFPSHKMFCVGVTGTNGKTTVSYMLSYLLSYFGWKTGLISTVQNSLWNWSDGQIQPQNTNITKNEYHLTTPLASELYSLLNNYYKKNAQAMVMEVSSIGLQEQRVRDVDFNVGVFTNLTADHLDYHPDMSSYFKAKKMLFETKLFTERKHFSAVLNFDDPYGIRLSQTIKVPYISYGQKPSQFCWKLLSSNLSGVRFRFLFEGKDQIVQLQTPGYHNVSNAVATLCCVHLAGFCVQTAGKVLSHFPGVRGRLERIQSSQNVNNSNKKKQPMVFIDYAHTPIALECVLSFLNAHKKSGRLICIFGCGGDRDKNKRPLMGKIAEKQSDKVFLTSDNPRTEDPASIIQDILKNVTDKSRFTIELDRKHAIQKALKNATPKDIVLIAGKGHESEQTIGNTRYPFDDRAIAQKVLSS